MSRDIPIIFSAPMIVALLEGRKVQTRRLVKIHKWRHTDLSWSGVARDDRLWVRENWKTFVSLDHEKPVDIYQLGLRGAGVLFPADNGGMSISKDGVWHPSELRDDERAFGRCRPSIHMPRWASRITLRVTAMRIEQLQSISDQDCISEGVVAFKNGGKSMFGIDERGSFSNPGLTPRESFMKLFCDINGPSVWADNPDVVVISFEVHKRNIDHMEAA